MRLRHKISIILGACVLTVIVALIGYSQTIAYKKNKLHSLAKSFKQLLQKRPEGDVFSVKYPPRDQYEEEYFCIVPELVSIAYSDIRLFREILEMIREEYETAGGKGMLPLWNQFTWTLPNARRYDEFLFFRADFQSTRPSLKVRRYEKVTFPDRKMLAELIDMLERTKNNEGDAIERDCISAAIVFHTPNYAAQYTVELPQDKHLTPAMLERILKYLKEKEDSPVPGYPGGAKHHRLSYFSGLVTGLARSYYDYPPVYEYALRIIRDRDKYHSTLRHYTLRALIERPAYEDEFVDIVIGILLDTTQGKFARCEATRLDWGKIDRPDKRRYFEALCKAAQNDPEESVRLKAIGRIKDFDDPKAKAFLEKLKSSTEK